MNLRPSRYQRIAAELGKLDANLPDKLADYYSKAHGIHRSFVDASDALCWYLNSGMKLSDIVKMVA